MKIKKIVQRLLVFFIGGPAILLPIYLFPQYNFLVYHIEVFIASLIANYEMSNILSQKMPVYPKHVLAFLGTILSAAFYLLKTLNAVHYLFNIFGIIIVLFLLLEIVFSFSGNFTYSIARLTSGVFILVYPWLLSIFLVAIASLPNARCLIITFLLMTFASDSIAWFLGILLGGRNRGFVKASPKKSIAGFIGGFLGSLAGALAALYFFEPVFKGKVLQLMIIACCVAFCAIAGDIVESILKRSADLKDSGKVILGRGGILDSIDSLLLSAPIFYTLYVLLFENGIAL